MSDIQTTGGSNLPSTQQAISSPAELINAMYKGAEGKIRDIDAFREGVKHMCMASSKTMYTLMYGTPVRSNGHWEVIMGPSVRFAEIIASVWGDISLFPYPPTVDTVGGIVTVTIMGVDAISRRTDTEIVTRSIKTSKGNLFGQQMIDNTIRAAFSIARRNVILRLVPAAVYQKEIDEIEKAAEKSAEADFDKFMSHLSGLNVTEKDIFDMVNVAKKSDLKGPHILKVGAIYHAIKDGKIKPEDLKEQNKKARGGAFGLHSLNI